MFLFNSLNHHFFLWEIKCFATSCVWAILAADFSLRKSVNQRFPAQDSISTVGMTQNIKVLVWSIRLSQNNPERRRRSDSDGLFPDWSPWAVWERSSAVREAFHLASEEVQKKNSIKTFSKLSSQDRIKNNCWKLFFFSHIKSWDCSLFPVRLSPSFLGMSVNHETHCRLAVVQSLRPDLLEGLPGKLWSE